MQDVLTPAQQRCTVTVAPVVAELGFCLGGGLAIALRHGHRGSLDFDYFRTAAPGDPAATVQALRHKLPSVVPERTSPGSVSFVYEGVPVCLLDHDRPVLAPPETVPGFAAPVLSEVDLIAMKVLAVVNRGARRDFIDLYVMAVASGLDAAGLLLPYVSRYAGDPYDAARALCYFRDADRQADPRLLKPLDWSDVKSWFCSAVAAWAAGRGVKGS
ncbi:MAG: nucleotidyl transferase AbiEii/AbiGii toxin family protein [Deltaproteobacteria bacterium]|nr:nucleotidyl transferase AbiEii/AbiGii toxin family protein [Deltaproteobacteria bacterium]